MRLTFTAENCPIRSPRIIFNQMEKLFTDLRQIFILSLDGYSLCQLASCNHKWSAFISDEGNWTKLLFHHFQVKPIQQYTAFRSYKYFYTWPQRSHRVF